MSWAKFRNCEKSCQAFFSLGIVFRKSLIVRHGMENQKSAFDKMESVGNKTYTPNQRRHAGRGRSLTHLETHYGTEGTQCHGCSAFGPFRQVAVYNDRASERSTYQPEERMAAGIEPGFMKR